MNYRTAIVSIALLVPALSAFAIDQGDVNKSVRLKDGSTVHQFKDGKMAMESKFGRAYRMKDGEAMQAADGSTITMRGDEVARLEVALQSHLGGGSK